MESHGFAAVRPVELADALRQRPATGNTGKGFFRTGLPPNIASCDVFVITMIFQRRGNSIFIQQDYSLIFA